MPYDPAGIYDLPSSYRAEPGTTIRSEQHNEPLADIAQALSFVLVRDGRAGMIGTLQMGGYPISNVAPGTAATDAATVGQLVPIGTVVDYAGSTAPAGWLFCAGQAVSRSTYAALFSVIGTTYGVGDGSTTFNLPDLRGRVTAGRDNMGGTSAWRLTGARPGGVNGSWLGSAGGTEAHQLHAVEMAFHQHTFSGQTAWAGAHSHGIGRGPGTGSADPGTFLGAANRDNTQQTDGVGPHSHFFEGTTDPFGSDQPHNNVQPTLIVNKIIRAAY